MNRVSRGIILFAILFQSFSLSLKAQSDFTKKPLTDTLTARRIELAPGAASEYIKRLTAIQRNWTPRGVKLREELLQLLHHYFEPLDTVRSKLSRYPFNEFNRYLSPLYDSVSYPIRWLNQSTFLIDTFKLSRDPLIRQKTVVFRVLDASSVQGKDSLAGLQRLIEDYFLSSDTVTRTVIDSVYLKAKGVELYRLANGAIVPQPTLKGQAATARIATANKLVLNRRMESEGLASFQQGNVSDSLRAAVQSLLEYTLRRDSVMLRIGDLNGRKHPLWVSTGKEPMLRVWVKNSQNDSITVWVGNPSARTIALHLDDDLRVETLEKRKVTDLPFGSPEPYRNLARHSRIKEVIIPWAYGVSSSFSFSGNYLSNWSRGGESTLSSLLDVTGKADYNNSDNKTRWNNNCRLRYGFTWTNDEHGLKTNTDILEANSQFNKVMLEKLDFSSVFYFKTQVANGFNYPKGQPKQLKSKFLSPGSFTIGVGAEYKPYKKNSLNISPLSYKNTFVLDTVNINQTLHGVDRGSRSKQEMGGQLVLRSSLTLMKDLEVTNALRLFSNYLKKPKNVDVDWELGLEKQISWYFKVRLNLHLIYDDDVRFAVNDSSGQPVLMPDGTPKKVAKTQINQFVGLTLAFKM